MSSRPHVGVIGAGLSGLRCADLLIRNGVRVTILEARDRIGGRVHQGEIGGYPIDLGPNWIHGSGENPIMDIAEATKTIFHEPEGSNMIASREGHFFSEEIANKVSEFVWTTIGEAFEYSNAHADSISPEKSLLDFFMEKVQQTGFSEEDKKMCLDACKLWGAYVGDKIDRQSLKFFSLEECIDGTNYFVAGTYKHILAHVAKAAVSHADIKLNTPIVCIEAPQRDDSQSLNQQVTVSTATGGSYTFDEVVVTCPLGWLKQNTNAFVPSLPDRLLQAINNISYGRLEKVIVSFPRAFWHDATSSIDGSEKPKHPVFAQFLEPSYTDVPQGIEWNQECLSLASFPEQHAQPTLLFYTYGPSGAHIVNQIADLDRSSAEYRTTLLEFAEPFYSRLPGYDPSSPDCVPTDVFGSCWQKDPYAGNGSYCNFQVGLTQADKDIEALRACPGVGERRGLWFAGEHTAPFVALGTTTGAYWSGERVAAQVCEKLALGKAGTGELKGDSLPSGRKSSL
ncbi:Amine oxidase [Penicillium atrosanguineum]|uniref:Amine oxidase n=1 Tax=Penicillium atrosanguineum TaxID=1132637 RepID=A0A9W9U2Q3_9EURO|nr:Amine oxidase [Penicillium atrosanguineum]KAJ5307940.1 Amine oxidase [Penicillium atrosanguineum]